MISSDFISVLYKFQVAVRGVLFRPTSGCLCRLPGDGTLSE